MPFHHCPCCSRVVNIGNNVQVCLPCLATFQTSQHIVINTLEPAYNQRVCDFKCWTEFRQRGRDWWCRNSNNFTTGVKQRQLNPTGHYQVPTQGLLNQFCIIFLTIWQPYHLWWAEVMLTKQSWYQGGGVVLADQLRNFLIKCEPNKLIKVQTDSAGVKFGRNWG